MAVRATSKSRTSVLQAAGAKLCAHLRPFHDCQTIAALALSARGNHRSKYGDHEEMIDLHCYNAPEDTRGLSGLLRRRHRRPGGAISVFMRRL